MSNFEALDDEAAQSLIEQQLRSIHPDMQTVRCEEETGQGLIVLESGEEMVRAEFKSESETYHLLKLYEDT